MYYVYVLASLKNSKKYTGFTRKSPEARLAEHNAGRNIWTKHNGPFDLLYTEVFKSRKLALRQEKYLKSTAGRKCLKKKLVLS